MKKMGGGNRKGLGERGVNRRREKEFTVRKAVRRGRFRNNRILLRYFYHFLNFRFLRK